MPFTANEIANIANSALDFYFNKGGMFEQSLQERPLLKLMEDKKKPFPGGKGNICWRCAAPMATARATRLSRATTPTTRSTFYTPATNLRVNFPWREHHIGLTLTHTELKVDGISVVDTNGERTTEHSKRELTVLVNLLESKLFDLGEQYARGMNGLIWGDGDGGPQGARRDAVDHRRQPGGRHLRRAHPNHQHLVAQSGDHGGVRAAGPLLAMSPMAARSCPRCRRNICN